MGLHPESASVCIMRSNFFDLTNVIPIIEHSKILLSDLENILNGIVVST